MYKVPCANTIYLNEYLKSADVGDYAEMVAEKMKEVRVCVTRTPYFNHMLFSPVLVRASQAFSPIIHPKHGEGIIDDSSEDHYTENDALVEGDEMRKTWAINQLDN
jgi:hypothetical protein